MNDRNKPTFVPEDLKVRWDVPVSIKVIDTKATSNRLSELMKEKGLKPRDMQRALDLESIQAVYKWLSPKYKSMPSIDNLVLLTHILDCSMEDIIRVKEVEIK